MKEKRVKDNILRYLQMLFGLFIFSLAFNLFLLPNELVFGGVSGLSVIFYTKYAIDPSLFVFFSSVILLFVSYIFLGKEITARNIVGSLLLPVFMKITEVLTLYIPIGNINTLVAALYGGVLAGFGMGLVYKTGFTTGGTDIINQIINKYVGFSIGKSMFVSDGFIVASGLFVNGIESTMYAGIVLFLIGKLSDRVILGISKSKAFYIITSEPEKIREFVVKKLGHGITELSAKGGFKKESQKMLMTVVPTQDYYSLKAGLYDIDKDVFFVAVDAYESKGGK